jgi:hypothetical protein
LRLRALADSPDAFGSTLAQEQDRDDAHWAARLAAGVEALSLPLVAELGAEPVGLAWARIDPAWARASNARSLALSVTCGSVPAERLYTAAGFTPAGAPEPIRPGSPLLVQPMQLELRAT